MYPRKLFVVEDNEDIVGGVIYENEVDRFRFLGSVNDEDWEHSDLVTKHKLLPKKRK